VQLVHLVLKLADLVFHLGTSMLTLEFDCIN
jgi:hypothetical protein